MAKVDSTSCFYVYVHRYASGPKSGHVFYVGKGTANRAWQKSSKRNKHWKRIVDKYGFFVEIVESGYQNWYAMEREIQLIEFYGLENLCNQTSGGEGGSGRVWSEESKAKLSAAKKGMITPWTQGERNHMKTAESKAKLSASKKGIPNYKIRGENNPMANPLFRERARLAQIGCKKPNQAGHLNHSARSVKCIETNNTFLTMKDAVRWLISIDKTSNEMSYTNIVSSCQGKLKSAYGFRWEYA